MMDLSLANAVSASNAVPSFINSGFTSKAEYDKFASLRGGGPEFAEPECLGSVAAFLYDAHRPYLSHRARLWGHLCDLISLLLVVQFALQIALASCEQKSFRKCSSCSVKRRGSRVSGTRPGEPSTASDV